LDIEVVLIAAPSATEKEMRRIVEICESTGIAFLILPSVQEALSGRLARSLRDVSIEDLLGRAPVRLDRGAMGDHLRGKRVLVTGGGGSIGSQLCREIAQFPVEELIVYERCEFNLYRVETVLSRHHPYLRLKVLLGDVTDRTAVERVIARHSPDVIYHAAAYKHVPLLQEQAREAVLNNVVGTRVVAEAAVAAGIKEFVLISTDKAVNPTNVMGATKRVAEMLVQGLNEAGRTRFVTVRFGNVLDSAGSVIPLFREQIKGGGPVTVTHPDITRYFMTIPEACQLILQSAVLGKGGDIFVLNMGEPIRILDLARDLITLSRLTPDVHIPITFTGLRPGEKLHEELWNDDETPVPTEHPHILRARIASPVALNGQLDWFREKIPFMTEKATRDLLAQLVREYAPTLRGESSDLRVRPRERAAGQIALDL
jgi:FlaA1/EpsC-like NDP-sugar epimerase